MSKRSSSNSTFCLTPVVKLHIVTFFLNTYLPAFISVVLILIICIIVD